MTGFCSHCGLRTASVRSACKHGRTVWVDGERAGTVRYAPHCNDAKCEDVLCERPWRVSVDRLSWRAFSLVDAKSDLADYDATVRFA